MRRVAVALAVLLVLASVPLPVTAHANHITAGAQVTPDGTLVVDGIYLTSDGYLTVHRDDGGEPGERIGVTEVTPRSFRSNLRVGIDQRAWKGWETGDVYLLVRSDDGDGTFDPETDPVIESFGSPVAATITVEKGDRAVVTAAQQYTQQTRRGTLDVRSLTTPTDGYLVVSNTDTGERVGTESVAAGTHEHVTVALDGDERGDVRLDATLHRGDGDGGIGEPLRAGETPVGATFTVERTGGGRGGSTATSTPTPALVTTPTASETGTAGTTTGEPTSATQPGFGLLVGGAAIALLVSGYRRQ
ncbi:hypothetical protein BRD20_09285 [Halobacteriales archaeon SW_8_65_20]|nr:MAG: hypothetical protein BRD20_09285 [Halobacteriales archaeon SW_8_65_20]